MQKLIGRLFKRKENSTYEGEEIYTPDYEENPNETQLMVDLAVPKERSEKELVADKILSEDGSFHLLKKVLQSKEIQITNSDQNNRKLPFNVAKYLSDKFVKFGIASATKPTLTVVNHYKDLITDIKNQKGRDFVSSVSLDCFEKTSDQEKYTCYNCRFMAYFLVDSEKQYIPFASIKDNTLRKEVMEYLGIDDQHKVFVMKASFRMLYVVDLDNVQVSDLNSNELKRIVIESGNIFLSDFLRNSGSISRMRIDINKLLIDEEPYIFKDMDDYKHGYSDKITWKKSQYTEIDPNILNSIGNVDRAVTDDVDFTKDIVRFMQIK